MPKEAMRKYNLPDGDLADFADQLVVNINRDMADFTKRGITGADVTELETLIAGFNGIKTDEELLGLVTTATEVKDASRKNIVQLREVRGIAESTFNNEGLYRTFGFDGMTELKDTDLHRLALRVVRMATEYLNTMKLKGLTQDMLTDIETTAQDFDKKINAITTAINNRELATQERIVAGNNLFAKVSTLARDGKNIYIDKDAAKYNDYLLPESDNKSGGDKMPPPPSS